MCSTSCIRELSPGSSPTSGPQNMVRNLKTTTITTTTKIGNIQTKLSVVVSKSYFLSGRTVWIRVSGPLSWFHLCQVVVSVHNYTKPTCCQQNLVKEECHRRLVLINIDEKNHAYTL